MTQGVGGVGGGSGWEALRAAEERDREAGATIAPANARETADNLAARRYCEYAEGIGEGALCCEHTVISNACRTASKDSITGTLCDDKQLRWGE